MNVEFRLICEVCKNPVQSFFFVFKLTLKHLKNLKEGNLIVFLKKNTSCSNVIFVTFAVLKLRLKHTKKNMEERNLIVFLKTHTSSSFWKEAVPMWYLWLLLFSSWYQNTWKRNMEERNLIVFLKTHTSSSFWKEAIPMWHLWLLLFSSWYYNT